MKIWIINAYGNIPGEGWREYRSTIIAEALNKRGHEVTWWVSNFEHRSKKFRSSGWKTIIVNEKYTVQLVPTTAYTKHISIARIKAERTYIKNLKSKVLAGTDVPDVIISGEPALFVSSDIISIVKSTKAKLIIDIIDLWPELFSILLPGKLSFLDRLFFAPLYLRRAWFLKKADALIAVSKDYLQMGLKANNVKHHEVIYWGVDVADIKHNKPSNENNEVRQYFGVIYAGTFGDNYDLRTIMDCALLIEASNNNMQLILAGDGVLKEYVEKFITENKLTKTKYVGRVSADELNKLYKKCDVGMSSYISQSTVSMPIKAYDYLAAGLPLINSLKRDLGNFVQNSKVGVQYEAENAQDMYRAIMTLYNDPDLLIEMKSNALKLANFFNKDEQYKKIVDLVETLHNE